MVPRTVHDIAVAVSRCSNAVIEKYERKTDKNTQRAGCLLGGAAFESSIDVRSTFDTLGLGWVALGWLRLAWLGLGDSVELGVDFDRCSIDLLWTYDRIFDRCSIDVQSISDHWLGLAWVGLGWIALDWVIRLNWGWISIDVL